MAPSSTAATSFTPFQASSPETCRTSSSQAVGMAGL